MNATAIGLALMTVLGYALSLRLHRKHPRLWLSPALLVPALIMMYMIIGNVSYQTYMQDSHWLVWLLGPATVAFAAPIYTYRRLIAKHSLAISFGIVFGMSAGVVSAYYLAQWFHFDAAIGYSLMARSISTPFAMELSERVGGSGELASVFTIITGIVGMVLGDSVMAVMHLRSHFAQGASLGNAAHGFGSSKAMSRHQEEGVIASLTMVLAGIFMVLVGPGMIHAVLWLNA